jgi:hypothetical protein
LIFKNVLSSAVEIFIFTRWLCKIENSPSFDVIYRNFSVIVCLFELKLRNVKKKWGRNIQGKFRKKIAFTYTRRFSALDWEKKWMRIIQSLIRSVQILIIHKLRAFALKLERERGKKFVRNKKNPQFYLD